MATQGPLFPGTVTTQSVLPEDDNDWTTPGNISANDGAEATITAATYDANDISFRLKGQTLGFTIPDGATIDGITVEIEKRDAAIGNAVDNRVQLLDAAGAIVGDNKADTVTGWPTNATIITYGGAADTWNATPTVAMVNDVDFGVVLSAKATAANTDIFVDFIRVTVTYTPNPIVEADGSASGASTVSGIGGATAGSPGSAVGVATISGVGGAIAGAPGTAAGISTPTGIGAALWLASGGSDGVAAALGISAALWSVIAASDGIASVSADGEDSAGGGDDTFSMPHLIWSYGCGKLRSKFHKIPVE